MPDDKAVNGRRDFLRKTLTVIPAVTLAGYGVGHAMQTLPPSRTNPANATSLASSPTPNGLSSTPRWRD